LGGSEASVAEGQEHTAVSWQAARTEAASGKHPVSTRVTTRLVPLMEVEMMTKQLSSGELDRLAAELLAALEDVPE
jgi:hypothetical protein